MYTQRELERGLKAVIHKPQQLIWANLRQNYFDDVSISLMLFGSNYYNEVLIYYNVLYQSEKIYFPNPLNYCVQNRFGVLHANYFLESLIEVRQVGNLVKNKLRT